MKMLHSIRLKISNKCLILFKSSKISKSLCVLVIANVHRVRKHGKPNFTVRHEYVQFKIFSTSRYWFSAFIKKCDLKQKLNDRKWKKRTIHVYNKISTKKRFAWIFDNFNYKILLSLYEESELKISLYLM